MSSKLQLGWEKCSPDFPPDFLSSELPFQSSEFSIILTYIKITIVNVWAVLKFQTKAPQIVTDWYL